MAKISKKNDDWKYEKYKRWVPGATSLGELVEHYMTHPYRCKAANCSKMSMKDCLVEYLDSLTDLTDFICGEINTTKAPLGPPYRMNTHQRLFVRKFKDKPLGYSVVNTAYSALLALTSGRKFKNFDELYEEVKKVSKTVTGFGVLATYDFSLRYGWHCEPRLEPDEYVYLHAGPKKSAIFLAEMGLIKNFDERAEKMLYDNLPSDLKRPGMTSKDVEYFLCHFVGDIQKLAGYEPRKK